MNKVGVVSRTGNYKTVCVNVTNVVTSAKYKKKLKRVRRYHVHDDRSLCKVGDVVVIKQVRPVSKLKAWAVVYDN